MKIRCNILFTLFSSSRPHCSIRATFCLCLLLQTLQTLPVPLSPTHFSYCHHIFLPPPLPPTVLFLLFVAPNEFYSFAIFSCFWRSLLFLYGFVTHPLRCHGSFSLLPPILSLMRLHIASIFFATLHSLPSPQLLRSYSKVSFLFSKIWLGFHTLFGVDNHARCL